LKPRNSSVHRDSGWSRRFSASRGAPERAAPQATSRPSFVSSASKPGLVGRLERKEAEDNECEQRRDAERMGPRLLRNRQKADAGNQASGGGASEQSWRRRRQYRPPLRHRLRRARLAVEVPPQQQPEQ